MDKIRRLKEIRIYNRKKRRENFVSVAVKKYRSTHMSISIKQESWNTCFPIAVKVLPTGLWNINSLKKYKNRGATEDLQSKEGKKKLKGGGEALLLFSDQKIPCASITKRCTAQVFLLACNSSYSMRSPAPQPNRINGTEVSSTEKVREDIWRYSLIQTWSSP